MEFKNVTAQAIGNVYFDGKVISHSITTADGDKKTFGVALAGEYHFDTEKAERMEVTAGSFVVTIDGSEESETVDAGSHFDIDAHSGFTVVAGETTQYICSYID